MKNLFETLLPAAYLLESQKEQATLDLIEDSLDLNEESIAYRETSHNDDHDLALEDKRGRLPLEGQREGRDKPNEDDPEGEESKGGLPVISLEEVSYHDTFEDCWIVLYDKVYDLTRFLQEHPGGEDVLMEYAGRDATISFRSVGHSHGALVALQEYLVGALPERERLFPSDGQTRWSFL